MRLPSVGPLPDGVCQAIPDLGDQKFHDTQNAHDDENLQNLKFGPRAHLSFQESFVSIASSRAGREAAGRNVLLHESVLLIPPLPKPLVKIFLSIQRDIVEVESPPVEVDRLWWFPMNVGAGQCEEFLTKLASSASSNEILSYNHDRTGVTYGTPS